MIPELTITVLHYNRWDLTKDCLASIDAQEIPCTHEKVLVDNGSTELLPSLPEGWQLARYKDNRGHIVGQNRCFESAQGEWVLFVANDVRLHPRCIRELWRNGHTFTPVQPFLKTTDGTIDNAGLRWVWPGYGLSQRYATRNRTSVSGSCYLMRNALWQQLGGFDEQLETSHEDIDFGLRVTQISVSGISDCFSSATATHLGNATLKSSSSHTRAAFHRDRLYVIKKHYRGLDRYLRLAAVNLLDSIPR